MIFIPVKPLPKELIGRLRKAAPKISRLLGRMQNIDPRRDFLFLNLKKASYKVFPAKVTNKPGRRVRQMNVSRNYPKIELVIKRVHAGTAKRTIAKIGEKVKQHNHGFSPVNYVLVAPHAYPIARYLVAMHKSNAPTIDEAMGARREELLKKSVRWDVGMAHFELAQRMVCERAKISRQHMLFLGYRKGKFIFMPLLDLL